MLLNEGGAAFVIHLGVGELVVGFVRPEAGVAAMAGEAARLGAELRTGVRVTEVTGRRDGVEVVTEGSRERFDAAVIATGPWMTQLAPWLPLKVERQVMAWFRIQGDADWFAPDRFPVFIHETSQMGGIYGFPTLDGASVKIARHHLGEAADPDHVQREVKDADLDPLRRFITTCLRGLTRHVTRTAVCMYTNTPDGHFAVGADPGDSRIVVVSACSGHGFKFAPVIGDIAADLAIDSETKRDISRFSVARFAKPG
jgi:sarcosine oxidase